MQGLGFQLLGYTVFLPEDMASPGESSAGKDASPGLVGGRQGTWQLQSRVECRH